MRTEHPFLAIAVLLFVSISVNGQYWEDMGFGPSGQIRGLASDSHRLVITGQAAGGGFIVNETFLWDGNAVEAMPTDNFTHFIHNSVLFKGVPYLAQSGLTTEGLYRFFNGEWEQVAPAAISGLSVRDSLLYVMLYGSTSEINGQEFNRIAAFDGEDFHVIDNGLTDNSAGFADLRDAIWYKGEFYLAGNIYLPGIWDIARWNPGTGLWGDVGGGFPGDWSVAGMLEHDGLLFIYGQFAEWTGCPGNAIVAWDGEQYWRLGDGALGGSYPTVTDAVVLNGELYVTGNFSTINGIPCNGFAKWDGTQWCVLPTGVAPIKLVVFQGDLYATGANNTGWNSPDSLLRFAKWVYEGEPLGCAETGPIGIAEQTGHIRMLLAHPNPSPGILNLSMEGIAPGPATLHLLDMQGRMVLEQVLPQGGTATLQLGHLPAGLYMGRVVAGQEVWRFKWVRE